MKRSNFVLVLAAAIALTGCGKSSPTSSSSRLAAVSTTPAVTAPVAQGYSPAQFASTQPVATGKFVLALSSLTTGGVAAIDVTLTGAGMAQPLTKRLTATDLKNSNSLEYDNLPAGALTATLSAFGSNNAKVGEQSATIQVLANQTNKLSLKLTGSPFSFTQVDPNAATSQPADDMPADVSDDGSASSGGTTGSAPDTDTEGTLGIEVVNKEVVRKFLLFKKLSVTVRVTNNNRTETLNGKVTVEFHKMAGLIFKEDEVVETLTAPVTGIAPGKSVEVTLQSTKSAEDAEATVDTVVSSSSASTRDE
jgi:hypothetical protein